MQEFWDNIADQYGKAQDLEQIQRENVAHFLKDKKWQFLELACGNGQTIITVTKYNSKINITWIDYNQAMIQRVKSIFLNYHFEHADVLNYTIHRTYDYVVCLNSMHNFPAKEMIFSFLQKAKDFVAPWGFFIFDIRNHYNPFIRYGYWKNRKRGLDFFTLKARKVIKQLESDFDLIECKGIVYQSLKEAGYDTKPFWLRLIYGGYLFLTQIRFFAPYQFIILQKKDV